MSRRVRTAAALCCASLLLAGCASVSPDGMRGSVGGLVGPRIGVEAPLAPPGADADAAVDALLRAPLTEEAAVRIALLQGPALQASLAALGIAEADRVQASRLPNPVFSIARLAEGSEREIERSLAISLLGVLTLPWRAELAGRQLEAARLQTALDVVRLAAEVRRAWIRAVAAAQSAAAAERLQEASEAGAELARRMARTGNWSTLQQARQQLALAESAAGLARARQAAVREREALTRLLGLWGGRTDYRLPDRLPGLPGPEALTDGATVESAALRERLDVRGALVRNRRYAASLGYVRAVGYLDGLDIGYRRDVTTDRADGGRSVQQGWRLAVPVPVFDWGGARRARARALYLQSAAQVGAVAVRARSEARAAWLAWRTAYDLARSQRDEVVPLRSHIADETVLRYNGMLVSVWEVLAEARASLAAVDAATAAERDFWLADTDLRLALTGGSPDPSGPADASAPAAPLPSTLPSAGH
ncbi:MAG: TolC family protein [Xylophilus ampelinus]